MSEMRIATLYLGEGSDGYKTGIGAIGKTDAETKGLFESAKSIAVDIKVADFLLDLYDNKGFIVETIGLSCDGYTQVTGEKVLSESEYKEIDKNYWENAKKISTGIKNGTVSISGKTK